MPHDKDKEKENINANAGRRSKVCYCVAAFRINEFRSVYYACVCDNSRVIDHVSEALKKNPTMISIRKVLVYE